MGKSQETWNKKEKEKKRQRKKEEKERKKAERQESSEGGSLENMIAYVDEYGNITDTPPDPAKKKKVKAENIDIGVPRREELTEEELLRKGVVTFYDSSKGYGFIRDLETQESLFTHVNTHVDEIKEHDRVTFKVEKGLKGPNAVDVKVVEK